MLLAMASCSKTVGADLAIGAKRLAMRRVQGQPAVDAPITRPGSAADGVDATPAQILTARPGVRGRTPTRRAAGSPGRPAAGDGDLLAVAWATPASSWVPDCVILHDHAERCHARTLFTAAAARLQVAARPSRLIAIRAGVGRVISLRYRGLFIHADDLRAVGEVSEGRRCRSPAQA